MISVFSVLIWAAFFAIVSALAVAYILYDIAGKIF